MKILVICLFLAGCASQPADFIGEPIEDAISQFGYPKSAIDFEGARAFYFEITKEPIMKKNKKLLDPDMPITSTSYKTSNCVYTMNALWTSTQEEWIIHSVNESPNCTGTK